MQVVLSEPRLVRYPMQTLVMRVLVAQVALLLLQVLTQLTLWVELSPHEGADCAALRSRS